MTSAVERTELCGLSPRWSGRPSESVFSGPVDGGASAGGGCPSCGVTEHAHPRVAARDCRVPVASRYSRRGPPPARSTQSHAPRTRGCGPARPPRAPRRRESVGCPLAANRRTTNPAGPGRVGGHPRRGACGHTHSRARSFGRRRSLEAIVPIALPDGAARALDISPPVPSRAWNVSSSNTSCEPRLRHRREPGHPGRIPRRAG